MQKVDQYLQILELGPNASFEEVRKSYRELVKVWHPDRFAHDSNLEKRAQEKLKQINLAYEALREWFADGSEVVTEKTVELTAKELFQKYRGDYYNAKTVSEKRNAAEAIAQLAESGYSSAQNFLGSLYYLGEIYPKSFDAAYAWWKKSAEQFNPQAQFALGTMYLAGRGSTVLESFLRTTINLSVGNSQMEAYKWFNLALTYGGGVQSGQGKAAAGLFLTDAQKDLARLLASSLYPDYPQKTNLEIFSVLTYCFEEECKTNRKFQDYHQNIIKNSIGFGGLRGKICDHGINLLKNQFSGTAAAQTASFFKQAYSMWTPKRSDDDWGRQIAGMIIESPYENCSDTFIWRRENAINHIWVNLNA